MTGVTWYPPSVSSSYCFWSADMSSSNPSHPQHRRPPQLHPMQMLMMTMNQPAGFHSLRSPLGYPVVAATTNYSSLCLFCSAYSNDPFRAHSAGPFRWAVVWCRIPGNMLDLCASYVGVHRALLRPFCVSALTAYYYLPSELIYLFTTFGRFRSQIGWHPPPMISWWVARNQNTTRRLCTRYKIFAMYWTRSAMCSMELPFTDATVQQHQFNHDSSTAWMHIFC